jgi:hypothetical protein
MSGASAPSAPEPLRGLAPEVVGLTDPEVGCAEGAPPGGVGPELPGAAVGVGVDDDGDEEEEAAEDEEAAP